MQRWRVLIADDEMIIREGIRDAVEWESLQLEIVAEAEDGEEALELAIKNNVHIILADLNMPIMNGMTLIKNINEQLPECKIIIITGHDEFSYAQEAIRLGVVDYILKPVNHTELYKVLGNVRNELEMKEKEKLHFTMTSNQINKNIPILRERFFIDWMEGHMEEGDVIEHLEFLQLPPSSPKIVGIIRWPEMQTTQPLMTERERQHILSSIEKIVNDSLLQLKKVVFRDHTGLIVIALWEDAEDELFTKMEKTIQDYLQIITIQYFEKVTSLITDISHVYKSCKSKVYTKAEVSNLVRRAEQYMNEHYHDKDLSLDMIAETLQVSSVYLSRMIKQDLEISFVTLLTKIRMKKAIQLLNTTNLTINEISEKVGYDTQHYFSTAFKKVMGVSPIQYRKGEAFANKIE
ncbi:response regulator transcription factor [Bacillus alkalicellulosilyticus]|uniref:response regulator transcription factor n=1 Tax=Alkalihalobacterium alkalicellulosilyticum TaxID=1912214 RepID=UPI0009969FE4|nr:response regulator [Bacillus alkalicellulosilyticus]